MTGEVTLSNQVLPIGGVKQKVLAAHKAGLREVILPLRNEPDLDDVPKPCARRAFHPGGRRLRARAGARTDAGAGDAGGASRSCRRIGGRGHQFCGAGFPNVRAMRRASQVSKPRAAAGAENVRAPSQHNDIRVRPPRRDGVPGSGAPAVGPSAPATRRARYRLKRKLLGKPMHSEQLEHERLGKPGAGGLASDNLSSSAYATEESSTSSCRRSAWSRSHWSCRSPSRCWSSWAS